MADHCAGRGSPLSNREPDDRASGAGEGSAGPANPGKMVPWSHPTQDGSERTRGSAPANPGKMVPWSHPTQDGSERARGSAPANPGKMVPWSHPTQEGRASGFAQAPTRSAGSPSLATLVTDRSPRTARVSANALMISAAAASTDTAVVHSVNRFGRPETSMVPAFVFMVPPPLTWGRSLSPRLEGASSRGIPEIRTDRGGDRYVLAQDPGWPDGNFEASSVRERMPSLR